MEEWNIIKNKFGVMKVCENNNTFDCWVDADRVCVGCNTDGNGVPSDNSNAFIDVSGRAWALFSEIENLFLVDINGDKKPNQFGKDRWIFTFAEGNGKRICDGGDYTNCNNPGTPKK